MRRWIPLLLLPLPLLHGCDSGGNSGGGGFGGGGTVVTPTPSPTPSPGATPTPSPSPTPASTEPANGSDFTTGVATLYSALPNIATCNAGQLKPEVGQRVLTVLNAIRAEHNLPPVLYASADEPAMMQSALMQAANSSLSHNPPTSWACYTGTGATASGQANLYIGLGSGLRYTRNDDIVIGWLTDVDNLVANSIGHRRWLLFPFLGTVAYGRVAGNSAMSGKADAASLKVINATNSFSGTQPAFVAYPYEDYPARYYANGALLSFSVIAATNTVFGANATVNFSSATISVRIRGGAALAVSNIAFDNDGFGLPNNLQWSVPSLTNNTIYDVTIDRVNVGGTLRTYTYYFRLTP